MIDTNITNMIEFLERLKELVSGSISYESMELPEELAQELDLCIMKLKNNDVSLLPTINSHFSPTGPYQELAFNGWEEEFPHFSTDFAILYDPIMNQPRKV